MSNVSTLLAWLIPCLILAGAFITWRVYVYKTQGPYLPESLRRNIFARTRSIIPRTMSLGSNKNTPVSTSAAVSGGDIRPVRNETRIDMPMDEQSIQKHPMTSIHSTNPQSFTPVVSSVSPVVVSVDGSISSSPEQTVTPVSPAISRLINMK